MIPRFPKVILSLITQAKSYLRVSKVQKQKPRPSNQGGLAHLWSLTTEICQNMFDSIFQNVHRKNRL